MKIRITTPIANRHRGELVDLDDGSAEFVISQGYAEPVDQAPAEPAPPADDPPLTEQNRRTRTRSDRAGDHATSQKVGDDPHSPGADTGTS